MQAIRTDKSLLLLRYVAHGVHISNLRKGIANLPRVSVVQWLGSSSDVLQVDLHGGHKVASIAESHSISSELGEL